MYITPTAVIKQINLLYNSLGLILFDRTQRGLSLTNAGKLLYQDTKYIISYCNDSIVRAQNAMSEDEKKFARFAENVWGISRNAKTDGELVVSGVEALADFIKETGLPTTLGELEIDKNVNMKEIAESCNISQGSYKKLTHDEILTIFEECK